MLLVYRAACTRAAVALCVGREISYLCNRGLGIALGQTYACRVSLPQHSNSLIVDGTGGGERNKNSRNGGDGKTELHCDESEAKGSFFEVSGAA